MEEERTRRGVNIIVEGYDMFAAVTMENAVFWDINTQFVPRKKHITSLLQSPTYKFYVRFDVFAAVTMTNVVVWDVASCRSCKNRRFGGMCSLHLQGRIPASTGIHGYSKMLADRSIRRHSKRKLV
jgi:hypothetical protein